MSLSIFLNSQLDLGSGQSFGRIRDQILDQDTRNQEVKGQPKDT